jgi:hypothetical protein
MWKMSLDEIAPKKGQRALVLGGSRSGKSVLVDMLIRHAVTTRPNLEALLLDSKPRFRAEIERHGPGGKIVRDAKGYYEDWEAGPTLPGSYRANIHAEKPLAGYWKQDDPCRIVIAQTSEETERPRLLELSNAWFQTRKRGADRLLIVDELLDFYHGNGVCISPRCNVPLKVNRAGGERGFSGLYGAQRPKGIPVQITEELSLLYLFHLRFEQDLRYLYENGVPQTVRPPEEDYAFRLIAINPGGKAEDRGLYRLKLEDWYTSQLSDT